MDEVNGFMKQAIELSGVSKRFSNLVALDGVDLSVRQGEFFGLLGPNGAGKSTLINALAGLLRVDAGVLKVMGYDVRREYRQARRKLGVVPQEIVIDPFFTVLEVLRFQSGYFGIRDNDEWINELLVNLNLVDKQNTNMRKLSGGMKRRVLIAQALVHKPPVLVLDEPTAGVDVELRQSMWRFIKRLHSEGHTMILTTHYLEEAEELCDRIAIIDHGKIIALESKDDLLERGLGSKLVVKAASDIRAVPIELQSKLLKLSGKNLELKLNRNHDSIMDILDLLRANAITIINVCVVHDSLEDVFVQMTGDNSLAPEAAE